MGMYVEKNYCSLNNYNNFLLSYLVTHVQNEIKWKYIHTIACDM
jgi:hypothetical protein